jgi:uncharacterized protein
MKTKMGVRRKEVAVAALFFSTVIGVFAIACQAERVEDLPKPTDYVSDYAHVLSPEAIARIDHICEQLNHSQANAQIAVVTIHTLGGADSADYATRLFEKMGIGKKGTDRGLLFLLAIDDHRRSIKVGYGLEGILPDAKTGDIGRDMVPHLKANDFNGAVTLGVDEAAKVIAADAKIRLDEGATGASQSSQQQDETTDEALKAAETAEIKERKTGEGFDEKLNKYFFPGIFLAVLSVILLAVIITLRGGRPSISTDRSSGLGDYDFGGHDSDGCDSGGGSDDFGGGETGGGGSDGSW